MCLKTDAADERMHLRFLEHDANRLLPDMAVADQGIQGACAPLAMLRRQYVEVLAAVSSLRRLRKIEDEQWAVTGFRHSK